jgi:putative Holliday junction resolvase
MGRILAIDYGSKKSGLAVTDELRLIANPLTTIESAKLIDFLKKYIVDEKVDIVVVGEPKTMDNNPSDATRFINPFLGRLKHTFPKLVIDRMDERFTSRMAFQAMIDSGLGKKARQNKELVDSISAAIILQSYLEFKKI